MHNFIAVVWKEGDLLKSFKQSNLENNVFFHVQSVQSNIFMRKLCEQVIFIILFTRLLCDNLNSLMYVASHAGISGELMFRSSPQTPAQLRITFLSQA